MSTAGAAKRAFRAPAVVVALSVGALAVGPPDASLGTALGFAALVLLCLVVLDADGRLRETVAAGVALLGVVALAQWRIGDPWAVAAVLVAVGGLGGYGLHRFERVALGFVEGGDR